MIAGLVNGWLQLMFLAWMYGICSMSNLMKLPVLFIKMKMARNLNVQATLLAILVKRLTTQQKIRLLNT